MSPSLVVSTVVFPQRLWLSLFQTTPQRSLSSAPGSVTLFPTLGVIVAIIAEDKTSILDMICRGVLANAFFSFLNFIYLFIYLWLCWVFVSVRGLSLVVASGGHSSSRCVGLSLSRPLLLQSTGSRHAGSVIVAHGPSRSKACGIFPDQGSNLCPLHWQADSQPLRHQGSPLMLFGPSFIKM